MSNGWYPSLANVLGIPSWNPAPAYAPLNNFVEPLELTPEERAWEASGYQEPAGAQPGGFWQNLNLFLNTTFPNVLATITGNPLVPGSTTGQAAARAATTTGAKIAAQLPGLLLVAGVAILGVVGAVLIFRPHKAK